VRGASRERAPRTPLACLIRRPTRHPLDVSRMVSPPAGRTRRRHAARPSVPRPRPRTIRTGPGDSIISRSGRTRRGRSSSFGSRSSRGQAGRAAAEPRPDRVDPGALGGSLIHLGAGRCGARRGAALAVALPRGPPGERPGSSARLEHPRAGDQGDDPPRAGDLAGARAVLRAAPKEVEPPVLVAFVTTYFDLHVAGRGPEGGAPAPQAGVVRGQPRGLGDLAGPDLRHPGRPGPGARIRRLEGRSQPIPAGAS
jgi:hypothetical protein